jgi:hypothetical protein
MREKEFRMVLSFKAGEKENYSIVRNKNQRTGLGKRLNYDEDILRSPTGTV